MVQFAMNKQFARFLVYIFLTNCITLSALASMGTPWQYIGNIKPLYNATKTDVTLLYQGQLIKSSEGIFLFKNTIPYQPLIVLFINPEDISLSGNENTVWYLTARKESRYQAFLCSLLTQGDEFNWHIQPGTLPESFDDEEKKKLIIPFNSLIIPLNPDIFKRDAQGIIEFENKKQPLTVSTIEFPMPIDISCNKKTLMQAIEASIISLINLRPLHVEQETHRVLRDHLMVTLLK